jgi:hypothetical protein
VTHEVAVVDARLPDKAGKLNDQVVMKNIKWSLELESDFVTLLQNGVPASVFKTSRDLSMSYRKNEDGITPQFVVASLDKLTFKNALGVLTSLIAGVLGNEANVKRVVTKEMKPGSVTARWVFGMPNQDKLLFSHNMIIIQIFEKLVKKFASEASLEKKTNSPKSTTTVIAKTRYSALKERKQKEIYDAQVIELSAEGTGSFKSLDRLVQALRTGENTLPPDLLAHLRVSYVTKKINFRQMKAVIQAIEVDEALHKADKNYRALIRDKEHRAILEGGYLIPKKISQLAAAVAPVVVVDMPP